MANDGHPVTTQRDSTCAGDMLKNLCEAKSGSTESTNGAREEIETHSNTVIKEVVFDI